MWGDRLFQPTSLKTKRPFHNLGNTLVRGSINRLFKNNIKDVMTGYRLLAITL